MLIDTHCHINIMVKRKFDTPLAPEDFDRAKIIYQEARQNNIVHIINVGTSLIESINCVQLAQKNKNMHAAVGIHPSDCKINWNNDLKEIKKLIKNKKENNIVAIGECGIDLYHQKHNLQQQQSLFNAQIELSLEHELPLTIHTRDATDELVSCLEKFKKENLKGVIHCFSEAQDFADYAIELGFLIGIGGAITYPKNETLRSVVLAIPLEKMILETDAPFLPPQIIRGKPNHPKYIAEIAQYISKLKKQNFDDIAKQTTQNAFDLFGL